MSHTVHSGLILGTLQSFLSSVGHTTWIIFHRYMKLTTGETLSKPSISRKNLAKEKAITQLHKKESIDKKNIINSKKKLKNLPDLYSFKLGYFNSC